MDHFNTSSPRDLLRAARLVPVLTTRQEAHPRCGRWPDPFRMSASARPAASPKTACPTGSPNPTSSPSVDRGSHPRPKWNAATGTPSPGGPATP
jgi:hypothetical protein